MLCAYPTIECDASQGRFSPNLPMLLETSSMEVFSCAVKHVYALACFFPASRSGFRHRSPPGCDRIAFVLEYHFVLHAAPMSLRAACLTRSQLVLSQVGHFARFSLPPGVAVREEFARDGDLSRPAFALAYSCQVHWLSFHVLPLPLSPRSHENISKVGERFNEKCGCEEHARGSVLCPMPAIVERWRCKHWRVVGVWFSVRWMDEVK